MTKTRMDIAKLGGPWSETMVWYARAVGELRTHAFDNPTAWTFLAAIHGIDPQGWLNQGILPPNPPVSPNAGRMFNQCQHAGWFFLPWHRGYLHAFEAILGNWIESEGGPSNWALPYWNYLSPNNPGARNIPQEFLDPTFDGGAQNPLAQARRGPATTLGPQTWVPRDITLTAQTETLYTSDPGTLGYGGPISGFAQQGNAFGATESDPHNLVHVMVGGDSSTNPQGWMYDPNFAALDPIFWVHHCNIDRLWAAWLTSASNVQETGRPWGNGPFPRQFAMPDSGGGLNVFIPSETLPGGALEPTYDDLEDGTGIPPTLPGGPAMVSTASPPPGRSKLVGANNQSLTVTTTTVSSRVAMSGALPTAVGAVGGSQRVFLNVEGVRGTSPSGVVNVILTAPGASPADADPDAVETLVFFGLANATSAHGPHGGNGLSQTVDITNTARRLLAYGPVEALDVHLAQPEASGAEITVDRISIFVREE